MIHAHSFGRKVFLVTFDGEGISRKVWYFGKMLNVFPYMPTALICLQCHGLGHKAMVCTWRQWCKQCGETHPDNEPCREKLCANCRVRGHMALEASCPSKTQADKYLQKRASAGGSTFTAAATDAASPKPRGGEEAQVTRICGGGKGKQPNPKYNKQLRDKNSFIPLYSFIQKSSAHTSSNSTQPPCEKLRCTARYYKPTPKI